MRRIPIASITFPRSENAELDCRAVHRSLSAANDALREAAWSAPRRAYDETEVLVRWADDELLLWQLELQMRHAHEVDPIGAELREMAEKFAGLQVPHWLTPAAWDRFLARWRIDRPAWRQLVERYQLSASDERVGEGLCALEAPDEHRRRTELEEMLAVLPEEA
jgi:hypothetical protein